MKKIALGFVALAALSTTALAAGNHSWDPGFEPYGYTETSNGAVQVSFDSQPLAIQTADGAAGNAGVDQRRIDEQRD
jgi:hypothetical protein